jgi:hypothetical protein
MFALRLKRTAKLTLFSIIIISLIIITKLILNNSKSQNLKLISLKFDSSINNTKITDNKISHKPYQELNLLSKNLKPIVINIKSNLVEKNNKTIEFSIQNVLNKTNLKFFSVDNNNLTLSSAKKLSYRLSSSERLWFMSNGSLRPDPKLCEDLSIWPNEGDLNDDRVINQLMFVPLGYSQQNSKFKTIYMYGYNDWFIAYGKSEFAACPVNSCEFVNQSYAPNADLIFFKV